VTFHHNLWRGTVQRTPRVRFGQVDVYDNYYAPRAGDYEYSIGVGKSSQIVAENNYVALPSGVPASAVLNKLGGSALTAKGNVVNGAATDLIAAWNAAHPDQKLGTGAGWTPTLRTAVDAASAVPSKVTAGAGAGRL
jgi:pectate lyase